MLNTWIKLTSGLQTDVENKQFIARAAFSFCQSVFCIPHSITELIEQQLNKLSLWEYRSYFTNLITNSLDLVMKTIITAERFPYFLG